MEEEKNVQPQEELIESKKNNNSVLIILLVLIILGVAGYFIYTKVINKDEPKKDNNTEEKEKKEENKEEENKEENEEEGTSSLLPTITYKSADGKKILKIVDRNDKEAAKKLDEIEVPDDEVISFSYVGLYNNTIYIISSDENTFKTKDKYLLLSSMKEGQSAQCMFTDDFIVNTTNNTLVLADARYKLHKVKDKYYFSAGSCAYGFISDTVYNEQLKRLGDVFLNNDDAGNIYVLDNSFVVKYDTNDKVLKQGTERFSDVEICRNSIAYNDTLYFVIIASDGNYLVDAMNNQKYKLPANSEYSTLSTITGSDGYDLAFKLEDNLINIYVETITENGNDAILLYSFNPTTKEIIAK